MHEELAAAERQLFDGTEQTGPTAISMPLEIVPDDVRISGDEMLPYVGLTATLTLTLPALPEKKWSVQSLLGRKARNFKP